METALILIIIIAGIASYTLGLKVLNHFFLTKNVDKTRTNLNMCI